MSEEYEEITLKLPKQLIEFLRAINCDVEEYLRNVILASFEADFDLLKIIPFFNVKKLKEKFNLKPVLEG
jgi:hypothetical protein